MEMPLCNSHFNHSVGFFHITKICFFFFERQQEHRKRECDHRNRNRQWGMSCYHLSLLVLPHHLKITEKNTHALACISLLFLYSSKLTDQNVQNPVRAFNDRHVFNVKIKHVNQTGFLQVWGRMNLLRWDRGICSQQSMNIEEQQGPPVYGMRPSSDVLKSGKASSSSVVKLCRMMFTTTWAQRQWRLLVFHWDEYRSNEPNKTEMIQLSLHSKAKNRNSITPYINTAKHAHKEIFQLQPKRTPLFHTNLQNPKNVHYMDTILNVTNLVWF